MLVCGYCAGPASIGSSSMLNNRPICHECNGSVSGQVDKDKVAHRQYIIEKQRVEARYARAQAAKRGISGVVHYVKDEA